MKKTSSPVVLSLACLIFGVLFIVAAYSPKLTMVPPADAQSSGAPNMTGWAWSSNIGWISVNCANTSAGCVAWGLRLVEASSGRRDISGYAWSNHIGWIKFNPGGTYPTAEDTVPSDVYLDINNQKLFGWARACNVFASGCSGALKPDLARGGWDGWISVGKTAFAPAPVYGVTVETVVAGGSTNLKFKNFAWGSDVVGWVNFSPTLSDTINVGCLNCDSGAVCGDTTITAPETCDDGNIIAGDGCSAVCQIEISVCGNGAIEVGEQCDDSNTANGDGCSSSCQTETCTGGACGGGGSCGNGVTNHDRGEACDNGVNNGPWPASCSASCQTNTPPGGGAVCGDTTITAPETCDDGNIIAGDGCSAVCQTEGTAACNPSTFGYPDCLPACVTDFAASAPITTTVKMPQTTSVFSQSPVVFVVRGTPNAPITIVADMININNKESFNLFADQKACIMTTGTPNAGIHCTNSSVYENPSLVIGTNGTRGRYVWIYSPNRGVLGAGKASPYIDCGLSGCNVSVTVTWQAIEGVCKGGSIPSNMKVIYEDDFSAPQSVGGGN